MSIDWKVVENKARVMSVAALTYSIRDCVEAAKAMQGHNPEREGYYMDEASIYRAELNRR